MIELELRNDVYRRPLATALDRVVGLGQRVARTIPRGRARDFLHGVWLGHPVTLLCVTACLAPTPHHSGINANVQIEPPVGTLRDA